MSDKTLYLIQSCFSHTDQVLTQLDQIYSVDDHILLMGDAVLYVCDHRLEKKKICISWKMIQKYLPKKFLSILN